MTHNEADPIDSCYASFALCHTVGATTDTAACCRRRPHRCRTKKSKISWDDESEIANDISKQKRTSKQIKASQKSSHSTNKHRSKLNYHRLYYIVLSFYAATASQPKRTESNQISQETRAIHATQPTECQQRDQTLNEIIDLNPITH